MARFYGTVQGNRGQATRMGHAHGGLRVAARSYSGSIILNLFNKDGEDWVTIGVSRGSQSVSDKHLYTGPIEQLVIDEKRAALITALALNVPLPEGG